MAGKVVSDTPVYEEFEPFCKWQRNEDRDILEVHLQDFKKEQLKVQISNLGVLKIFGERPIDAKSTHTKFYKEVPLPSNKYDTHAIHAKFVKTNLIITLPKIKIPVPETNQKVSSFEPSSSEQTPPTPEPTTGAPNIGGGAKEQTPVPGGNASTDCRFQGRKRATMGVRMAKVAVSLAATAAVVAVLVAYVAYMYKSTVAEIDD